MKIYDTRMIFLQYDLVKMDKNEREDLLKKMYDNYYVCNIDEENLDKIINSILNLLYKKVDNCNNKFIVAKYSDKDGLSITVDVMKNTKSSVSVELGHIQLFDFDLKTTLKLNKEERIAVKKDYIINMYKIFGEKYMQEYRNYCIKKYHQKIDQERIRHENARLDEDDVHTQKLKEILKELQENEIREEL